MLENIYTITTLNQVAATLLETQLGRVKVQGEVSNLKKASSGHYYFSLKDAHAQVNCVLFSSQAYSIPNNLFENGKQVIATAKVGLYQPRGDYQLNISFLEDAGTGSLQIAFEALKKKLAAQGLFDPQFKLPIPKSPETIGVVTSPHGAAIRDILATLKRRFIAANIIIYPTDVQGQQAAPKIAQAIQIANARKECDVLIVSRGGGSAEDLWSFNEEIVAWAIFNSEIPIVTGIGHQVDTTIADYVADYATSTPTAAAESVSPDSNDWLIQTQQFLHRAHQAMRHYLEDKHYKLSTFKQKFQQYPYYLQERSQTLDRLENAVKQHFNRLLNQKKNDFHHYITALRIINPLATLERGYAVAMTATHKVIREPEDVNIHDLIDIRLEKMHLLCKIEEINRS